MIRHCTRAWLVDRNLYNGGLDEKANKLRNDEEKMS